MWFLHFSLDIATTLFYIMLVIALIGKYGEKKTVAASIDSEPEFWTIREALGFKGNGRDWGLFLFYLICTYR